MSEITQNQGDAPGPPALEWVRIIVFAAMLAVPGVAAAFGYTAAPKNELSKSAPSQIAEKGPPASPFSGSVQWFARSFPFRGKLVEWQGLLIVRTLGASTSDRVMVGEGGWLFLARESPKPGRRMALAYTRNAIRISEQSLRDAATALERSRQRLAAQGTRYVLVVAPNKETTYPEFLPLGFTRVAELALDQLVSVMRAQTGVPVVDLREPLRRAKQQGELFYRTDTHWNALGALAAQEAIIREVGLTLPTLAPLKPEDFRISRVRRPGGDLARLLGMQELMSDEAVQLTALRPAEVEGLARDAPFGVRDLASAGELVTSCNSATVERAVVQRDSFGDALVPLLAPHFKRTVFISNPPKDYVDWTVAERERPEVLIHLLVERSVLGLFGRTQ